ncbi:hypothetical protein [Candidatus Tisiphia endosymbiont of Oplodontha viridula]|uniref:hypothetical protein n=1 Tax=Candidatus Tisiphia endosymbiont of Oplodontha viridula TaxID=3077925 RepID=UPI0035C8B260
MARNGLLRRLTPSRNDAWVKAFPSLRGATLVATKQSRFVSYLRKQVSRFLPTQE